MNKKEALEIQAFEEHMGVQGAHFGSEYRFCRWREFSSPKVTRSMYNEMCLRWGAMCRGCSESSRWNKRLPQH